jgi:hypothetical protein
MTGVSFAAYALALGQGAPAARSQAILTLFVCFALLVLAGRWRSLFGRRRNRALLPVVAGTLGTLLIAFEVPWFRSLLGLSGVSRDAVLLALSLAAVFGILERLLRAAAGGGPLSLRAGSPRHTGDPRGGESA